MLIHPTLWPAKATNYDVNLNCSRMSKNVTDTVISAEEVEKKVEEVKSDNAEPKALGVNKSLKKPRKPKFTKVHASGASGGVQQYRQVPIPPHRMTPLRDQWMQIYEPIVKQLNLQIRMNPKKRCVELRTCKKTKEAGALQKAADFVKAFVMGFSIQDAIALLRLDDLYLESFMVQDVRSTLKGDHLSRAVGRIAGKDGKTKFTIENATKTRVVVADTRIHILGSYENTRLARRAICNLVLGAAPGKVYNKLQSVSARLNERRF